MYEFIAVVAGLLVGGVVWQIHRPRMRAVALAVLSVTIGVLVAAISGEILESWAFALVDTAQVALAAIVALTLIGRLHFSRG